MTGMSAPALGESPADAGERIRAACPVQSATTATNEDCRIRAELVAATSSVEEAELDLTIWWEHRCHWVIADPESRVFHAYLPRTSRAGKGPPPTRTAGSRSLALVSPMTISRPHLRCWTASGLPAQHPPDQDSIRRHG